MRAVIGLNLGYNSSAALVSQRDGVKLAISEERLIGEKNTKRFPIRALSACIEELLKGDVGEVNIGLCHYEKLTWRYIKYVVNIFEFVNIDDVDKNLVDKLKVARDSEDIYSFLETYIRIVANVPDDLRINLKRYDHHTCHRLPAYYMSGFGVQNEPTISVVSDGFGDGLSLSVYNNKTGEMLTSEGVSTSLGLVYQFVTGALGYKEHQHEGKITGLAAHGKPFYVKEFEHSIISFDNETGKLVPTYLLDLAIFSEFVDIMTDEYCDVPMNPNINGFKEMFMLRKNVVCLVNYLFTEKGATPADIAASVQAYTEKMVQYVLEFAIHREGKHMAELDKDKRSIDGNKFNITLSGGLFANVKVNYHIKKELQPKNLFILPPMGDEGCAIGAAISIIIDKFGSSQINHYAFSRDELYPGKILPYEELGDYISSIAQDGYKVTSIKELENDGINLSYVIAELLAKGKTVCMSRSHSEFGPRALGNHSILYDASLWETNDSLNAKLGRTEFMPFAPITIDKFKRDLFKDYNGLSKTLKYMTITLPVTDEFAEEYKAACHVDKTARPQILSIEDNQLLYHVISHYNNITGKKALINTSYNLHNQPIIYFEETAIDSFIKAELDFLVLNDYIIEKK